MDKKRIRTKVAPKVEKVLKKINMAQATPVEKEVPKKSMIKKIPVTAIPAEEAQKAPVPQDIQVKFYMSKMVSITLSNGTRLSFAEGTSYEQGAQDLEVFKGVLKASTTE